MAEVSVWAGAVASAATAVIWLAVGLRLLPRNVPAPASVAARRFAIWWIALGLHTVLAVALAAAIGFDAASPAVAAGLAYAAVVLIAVMFWGLLSYLAYLFIGRSSVYPVVTAAYVIQGALLFAVIWRLRPDGATMSGITPVLTYAHSAGASVSTIFAFIAFLPPLIAAALYLTLAFRAPTRTVRYRVILIGASITIWFSQAILVQSLAPGDVGGQIASRLVGVAAALAVLIAYEPPAWLRRALHVERLGEEVVAQPPSPAERARRSAELARRARELI